MLSMNYRKLKTLHNKVQRHVYLRCVDLGLPGILQIPIAFNVLVVKSQL